MWANLSILINWSRGIVLVYFLVYTKFRCFVVNGMFRVRSSLYFRRPYGEVRPTGSVCCFASGSVCKVPLTSINLFIHRSFLFFVFFRSKRVSRGPLPRER